MTVETGPGGRKTWLAVEFVILFFGVIGLYALVLRGVSPVPFLLVVAVGVVLYLRRCGFDRHDLRRSEALPGALPGMLALFAVAAVALGAAVALLRPEALFDLPRERPLI